MTPGKGQTRRNFLKASAGAFGATCVTDAQAGNATDELLIIDCHAHIYGEDERKYPTIEKP